MEAACENLLRECRRASIVAFTAAALVAGPEACGSDNPSSSDGSGRDAAPGAIDGASDASSGTDASGPRACSKGPQQRVTLQPSKKDSVQIVPLASGGFAVAWKDDRDGHSEIYFRRLDVNGVALGSDVRVTTATTNAQWPSLVTAGNQLGIFWVHDFGKLRFERLDDNGAALGSAVDVLSYPTTYASAPVAASDGSGYAVVWRDPPEAGPDTNGRMMVARVDGAGALIGSPVELAMSGFDESRPALTWAGNGYGLAYYDTRDGQPRLSFTELDTNGAVRGTPKPIFPADTLRPEPAVVWTGAAYAVTAATNGPFVRLGEITPTGNVVATNLSNIKFGSRPGVNPSTANARIASSGAGYGIVYEVHASSAYSVVFAEVSPAGGQPKEPIDLAGLGDPSVAWNGQVYAAAYLGFSGDVYVNTITCQ